MSRRDPRSTTDDREEGLARPLPFVVGQWVCGERFYGRETQIDEILDGPGNCLWLLGTRRIGKTSLLKQVELLTARSPQKGYLPIYWNLQGADSAAELNLTFNESLLDAELRLKEAEFDPGEHQTENLFAAIGRLRRHLRRRDLKLLLLCDEAQELIRLGRMDVPLLRKLRRMMQAQEGVRFVLASTTRLWGLGELEGDAAAFLQGLRPPLYLGALTEAEASALVSQANSAAGGPPRIDDESIETICRTCGNHPYFLQLLARRYLETGDLKEAFEQLSTDPMAGSLFASELETLSEPDQTALTVLSEAPAADFSSIQKRLRCDSSVLKDCLQRLENLGLIRRDAAGRFVLGNSFMCHWLKARSKDSHGPAGTGQWGAAARRATQIVADLSLVDGTGASSPEELLDLVYEPLRELARRYLRRERPGHTLQPTALVHEAYLKLVDQTRVNWKGRSHFFAVGAKIMRRILIDHARSRKREKRGGGRLQVTLTGLAAPSARGDLDTTQLLALHAALKKLTEIDERQARVVELRFFAGLTMAEVAEVLGVSKRTVDTAWAKARTWLEREIAGWVAEPP